MKVIIRGITFFVLSGFLCLSANPESASGRNRPKLRNNLYIVQMSESPVVAYKGGIDNRPLMKPRLCLDLGSTRHSRTRDDDLLVDRVWD